MTFDDLSRAAGCDDPGDPVAYMLWTKEDVYAALERRNLELDDEMFEIVAEKALEYLHDGDLHEGPIEDAIVDALAARVEEAVREVKGAA